MMAITNQMGYVRASEATTKDHSFNRVASESINFYRLFVARLAIALRTTATFAATAATTIAASFPATAARTFRSSCRG